MSRSVSLVGVDGSTWDLTAGPVAYVGSSPRLWGTVPSQITEQIAAMLPGARVSSVRHGARDLVLPLTINAATPVELEQCIAALAKALDPMQGEVVLTVGRPDGSQRWISARCVAGLEMLALEWCEATTAQAAIALRAHDPYWLSADADVVVTPPAPVFTSGTTPFDDASPFDDGMPFNGVVIGTAFSDPEVSWSSVLPWSGHGGGVVLTTITNPGDVDAWPIFTITGDATAVSASNITTGRAWALDAGLAAGERLIVDTTPGERSVTIAGHNAYGRLRDGSSLWSFPPGDSTVALRFDGAGTGAEFSFSWSPRWLTC